jgi:hypothetical protein
MPISRLGKQVAEVAAALNANSVGFALIAGRSTRRYCAGISRTLTGWLSYTLLDARVNETPRAD